MANLGNLPPELLDHITSYLPTASAVSNLSQSSQWFNKAVEKDGWATFNRSRFPTLPVPPANSEASSYSYHRDAARTLVTLSRNWDRRAFVTRYVEPNGSIRGFPGNKKIDRWKRPRGQTIGFTPQLDSYEIVGPRWSDRKEVLAFSAGAEICVRMKEPSRDDNAPHQRDHWTIYRPPDAREGRDDITSLHLLRPGENEGKGRSARLLYGTANGSIELCSLPLDAANNDGADVDGTHHQTFDTDGHPVRSVSLSQHDTKPSLAAAALGETRISLYDLDHDSNATQSPISQIDVPPPENGVRTYRAWSTKFISPTSLAVGLGPSDNPVHVYQVLPSGLDKEVVRRFSLQNDLDRLEGEITFTGFAKKSTSSVYPIVPLPPPLNSNSEASVFLSGAYDGIVRLHDLRSNRHVEGAFVDLTDDSAIYSLLPRGWEQLVVGTSRHSLLKIFDMRMGSKCYSYRTVDGLEHENKDARPVNCNLFLKPHSATYPGRGGGNNWARRSAESSIYSLTYPSPTSPFVYAGVENAVMELAFTNALDHEQDPAFFAHHTQLKGRRNSETLSLAMYEQQADRMQLLSQRSIWEMRQIERTINGQDWPNREELFIPSLDERWKVGT